MIELSDVTVGYGKKDLAQKVSLTAKSGEITVLLGKNGSGKSTVVKAVCGNLPYGGSITLDGAEVCKMKPNERSRRVSLMPQIQRSPNITVREMVSYGRQPYTGFSGILTENDKSIVQSVIQKTGLTSLSEKSVNTLSGGERQKTYFAMLLAQDTPNIVLDEPGTFLDAQYMNFLCSFLLSLKKEGKTVLAVLHDINRALEIADRLAVLDGGKFIFTGTAREFILSGTAKSLFGLEKYEGVGGDGKTATFFK